MSNEILKISQEQTPNFLNSMFGASFWRTGYNKSVTKGWNSKGQVYSKITEESGLLNDSPGVTHVLHTPEVVVLDFDPTSDEIERGLIKDRMPSVINVMSMLDSKGIPYLRMNSTKGVHIYLQNQDYMEMGGENSQTLFC